MRAWGEERCGIRSAPQQLQQPSFHPLPRGLFAAVYLLLHIGYRGHGGAFAVVLSPPYLLP